MKADIERKEKQQAAIIENQVSADVKPLCNQGAAAPQTPDKVILHEYCSDNASSTRRYCGRNCMRCATPLCAIEIA